MFEVYVDATCESWKDTQGKAKGIICLYVLEKGAILKNLEIIVPNLRQFSNRFEYAAIEQAIFQFKNKKELVIYSDSQVAVKWANKKLKHFGQIKWIPRKENWAGIYLEKYGQNY